MSLDIWLNQKVETEVVSMNITHNLSGMWKEAGVYKALYKSGGKKAKKVIPVLEEGLEKMKANPDHFRKFSSPNGWGTYEQAVDWLERLIEGFKKNPNGVIGIWE